jgi:hypothetical protein
MLGLCTLWAKSKAVSEKHICLAVLASLFTAPHMHYHDLTLLLVPLVVSMLVLVHGGYLRARDTCLAPLAVSLVLLFGSLVPVLKYNLPYLVMFLIVLVAWFPDRLFRAFHLRRSTT